MTEDDYPKPSLPLSKDLFENVIHPPLTYAGKTPYYNQHAL